MIYRYQGNTPKIADDSFIAPNATVIGKVSVGKASSIWYGCVVRGDIGKIVIGEYTNIQDLSLIHITENIYDCFIGDRVTVGHRVILHGCTIKDNVLIGNGAIILDGAEIGPNCIIGAGSVVTPRTIINEGHLAWGSPARVVRKINDQDLKMIQEGSSGYMAMAKNHLELHESD